MAYLATKPLIQLYVRVVIVLTCGKHLPQTHDIIKTGDVGHKTSLTLPLFIEVSLTSQESEWFIFMSAH